jgi:hypothetical protein
MKSRGQTRIDFIAFICEIGSLHKIKDTPKIHNFLAAGGSRRSSSISRSDREAFEMMRIHSSGNDGEFLTDIDISERG